MRNLIKSVAVWMFALLAAAAVVVATISVTGLRLTFYQMYDTKTKDTLPDYKAGELLPFGWKYTGRELSRDHVWKYGFAAADGADIEIFFQPAEPSAPCFARTQLSNVLYKSPRRLTADEENGLLRITETVKQNERALKYSPLKIMSLVLRSLPDMMIVIIIYLLIVLLIYDVLAFFSASGDGVSSGNETAYTLAGRPSGRGRWLYAILGCVFAAVLLIVAFKNSYWAYLTCDEFFFLPHSDARGVYMAYVTGDYGMPAIPYRAVLPLLMRAQSLLAVRLLPVIFVLATAWSVYRISLWYVRPQLAWLAPVAMISCSSFETAITDLRGYSLFIFLGVFSLLTYGMSVQKQRKTTFYIWAVSSTLAVMSNPVIATFIAAMLFHYFFFMRKRMSRNSRRLFDIHSFFVLLLTGIFSSVIVRAALWHKAEHLNAATPFLSGLTPFILLCVIPLAVCAYCFRKDLRGAVALSAFAGASAAVVLLASNILGRADKYYLFTLPLIFVAVAYIAEALLQGIEKRRGLDLRFAAAAASVLIALIFFVKSADYKQLGGAGQNEWMSKSISYVEKILEENNKDNLPVLIYPLDHFFFFVEQKYGLNHLSGIANSEKFSYPSKEHGVGNGDILFRYDNYFTAASLKQENMVGSPAYIVFLARDSGRIFVDEEVKRWYRACGDRCRKLTESDLPAVYYYNPGK